MLNSCLLIISQRNERGGALLPHDVLNSCLFNCISAEGVGLCTALVSVNYISAERVGWCVATSGRARLMSVNSISAESEGW